MKYAMLFVCAASLLYGVTAEYTETRMVEPGTVMDVYNMNGDIIVMGWNEDKVEINIVKKTNKDAKELEKATCEISTGAKLVVKTKYVDEQNIHVSVSYNIKVPSHVRVGSLETANGDIEITGTRGDIELNTANGDITATGLDRLLEAVTSNGRVKAELTIIPEDGIKITSVNGTVTVSLNKDLDCEITASTVNGHVSVQGLDLSAKTGNQVLMTGTLGDGGPEVKVTTVNGHIKINNLAD